MFLGEKLVDALVLNTRILMGPAEREPYIQGAIHHLLEKWEKEIKEQDEEPRFFIKDSFAFYDKGR